MPSRNKKNKNRPHAQPTSGANASKNGATSAKISDNLEEKPTTSQQPVEPSPDFKCKITVAKEKLQQLQDSVDSIKASISQAKEQQSPEKTTEPSPVPDVSVKCDEQPIETQTMKKKRNRNRNRKKNSPNADESGVSSTTGTHESSPTASAAAAVVAVVLPVTDVITSEIKEKSNQTEDTDTLKDVKNNRSETETAEAKLDEIGRKADEENGKNKRIADGKSKQQIDKTQVKVGNEKNATNKVANNQNEPIEMDKCAKENGKENKSQQEKNANKNQKEKPNMSTSKDKNQKKNDQNKKQMSENQGKNDKNDENDKIDKIESSELKELKESKESKESEELKEPKKPTLSEPAPKESKEILIEANKSSPEVKNRNNKTAKESKKSPKPNKKNQAAEVKDVPEQKATEQIDESKSEPKIEPKTEPETPIVAESLTVVPTVAATVIEKESVIVENVSIENVEKPEDIAVECEKTTEAPEASQNNQPENLSIQLAESKIEKMQPELPKEATQEVPPIDAAIDKALQTLESSSSAAATPIPPQTPAAPAPAPPAAPPRDAKKAKNKKSPPQNRKQNEQCKEESPKSVDVVKKEPEMKEQPKVEQELKSEPNIEPSDLKSNEQNVTQLESSENGAKILTESVDSKPKIETLAQIVEKTCENPEKIVQIKCTEEPSESKDRIKNGSQEELKLVSDVQPKIEAETKKAEIILATEDVTKTPTTTPVLTTPAPEAAKKPIQQEDETAKIWKILEEASKSLEPVEIQMYEGAASLATEQIPSPADPTASIVCSTKDERQIEAEAKDLVNLLDTKESNKSKPNAQKQSGKPKENNQRQKQSSPSKTIEVQPRKTVEPKKKEVKPAGKGAKTSKGAEKQEKPENLTPPKTPEKTPQESPPPIEKTNDPPPPPPVEVEIPTVEVPAVEVDIPLDVSIMPNEIEASELIADSKNVQGSGFVPSVDQTTAEAKSLTPEIIVKKESTQQREVKSKSKSPVNLKKETQPITDELQQIIAEQQVAASLQSPETKPLNEGEKNNSKSTNNVSAKPKEQTKQPSPQPTSAGVGTEKRKDDNKNTNQKDTDSKSAPGKSQNSKKSSAKPIIPPKPDHLVSSQAKKTQAAATKSRKTEKILVLSGTHEDDDSEDDYIEYKFMPRQVFISTICQSCKKPTKSTERIPCQFCQMVSYCCAEHVTKDEALHKDLCGALQEIAKKRGGHIYNNARILNNNDYRSLRVHTLNLCENFLKRPLQTFEREILLFPRLCSTPTCREWRQNLLTDCESCGQVFYCTSQSEHLIETHQRWCKSVALYQKLVVTQSISGRIEPSLPSRIQSKPYKLPNSIAEVFKDLYKNYSAIKDDCVFATLTQLATAPLTAYFATQKAEQEIGEKFTIHLIGAELQFEADVLDIWETFFMHLAHNLMELTIVFCGPELNAENIPLDIISRIRMCRTCRQTCRIVKFDFQCAKLYHDYAKSSSYSKPDLICFFNPGFHHINSLNGLDTWSETIKVAANSDCPVLVTSYTEYESPRDLDRFQSESASYGKQMTLIHGPEYNVYSSQRPERNFISDEIVPLIFKNYFCFVLK